MTGGLFKKATLFIFTSVFLNLLNPEAYNIITQVMAEVKDEVVESDRLQNEVLQGEVTLYTIF